ncbi:unnamed protein product [Mytilus coruscus]|uniref:MAM domain-containing protein n=1 Tax=Mytilus coruscus TaxID=42192 RepID=A0A6J8EKV1_MYTCO|nr:unnamed protein product [Mytilus coruscus]
MYGSSINELQVQISSNSDTNGKVVWSKKYQQGNKWHSASVDIPALYGLQIKFVGIRGNSYRGDIGVDEVKLQRGTCDSVCPNNIEEDAGVNCTFSKRNACNYTTETGDWMYKSYSTPGKNLPPTDVSGRSFGYYFYQSSNGKEGDSSRLFSPYFTSSSSSTVRFYSYFGGSDVGSLRVSTIDDSGKTTSLWYKHGEQANGWLLSCISLKQEAELLLEFVASRSSDGDAAIAVDNVTLSEKPCMFGIAETVCDFDHPYMCGYKVNCSCTQQSHLYKWIRHTGPTASKHTGPESDSESDGYYMYAEATFGDHSDATSLKFPEFKTTGSQNLQFKYHMYGSDTGTLMVQAKNKGNNSITKIWSLTGPQKNDWKQICMPLTIAAQTIVELSFVAIRGDGPIGDIAIDDVLVTEEECPHTASCDFSYGTCDYHVTWNDYIVKWIRGHHVGIPFSSLDGFYFYVVSTKWKEGTQTFLFSKIFQAYGTESVSFDYINSQYTKFEVGWIEAPTDNTTLDNIKYSDINILHTTTNKVDHWTKRCVSLGAMTRNISIVFVHTSGVSDTQLTAVDNVEVSMSSCNEGIYESSCGFEPLDLCGYDIITPDKCPTQETYRWTVANENGNNVLYADGSLGEPDDMAVIEFPNNSISSMMFLHFKYMVNNWNNDKNLMYSISKEDDLTSVVATRPYLSAWQTYCVGVPGPKVVNLRFQAKRNQADRDSDIYIDDVNLSSDSCPAKTVTCDFDDSVMCGYYMSSSWKRTEHNAKTGDYYMAVTPSSSTSFSLVSPYRLATNNVQCLQFRYIFTGSSKAQLLFKLHRENSESTKVSLEGTRIWNNFLYQIEEKFDFLVFILDSVHPLIGSDEAAGIDDVKISTGTCLPVDCKNDEYRCASGLQCIPQSYVCDSVTHCVDGSDEKNCDGSITCDFESPRICEYTLTGYNIFRINDTDGNHHISIPLGDFHLLQSPLEYIPTASCLSFLTKVTYNIHSAIRLSLQDVDGLLMPIYTVGNMKATPYWTPYKTNIPSGNYSVVFEKLFPKRNYYGYLKIDDVVLHPGECSEGCIAGYFNCTADNVCIPEEYVCDRKWYCSDGEDEMICDYSITCSFDEDDLCEYDFGSWKNGSSDTVKELNLLDHTFQNSTGSYMYTGDLDGLYHDREMTSPTFQIDKPMCVEFFYVLIRTHEYSSTFLAIHQNTTYKNNEAFSLVEYRTNVNNQWQRGKFPVDVGIISLRFTAGGHRSVVAIDDVLLKDRNFCSDNFGNSSVSPSLLPSTVIPATNTSSGGSQNGLEVETKSEPTPQPTIHNQSAELQSKQIFP